MVPSSISYIASGLSVVPTIGKRPAVNWKIFQHQKPTKSQALGWWNANPDKYGMAIVCGIASGGLAVLDFDNEGAFLKMNPFISRINDDLPIIKSPHGHHIYLRCTKLIKTMKLAMNGSVLVELKGVGGYVIAPPSEGYSVLRGSITNIPTLTESEIVKIVKEAKKLDKRVSFNPPRKHHKGKSHVKTVGDIDSYVQGSLARMQERVATEIEGKRNETLFVASCSVGEFVGGEYITMRQGFNVMLEAATASGLYGEKGGKKDVAKTINSGIKRGMLQPIKLQVDSLLEGMI